MQEVLNNPLVSGMSADLARNEARLQELNSKFGDNHPQVVEAKANIAELRSKIDGEIRRITGGVGVTNTITRQRESQVRAALEAQRAKVLQHEGGARRRPGAGARGRKAPSASYESVMARLNQTSAGEPRRRRATSTSSASPSRRPCLRRPRSF